MNTNAWAYLNVTHPVCAWATYRGCLVPTPSEPGFLSVWLSGKLRAGDHTWLDVERELEAVRQDSFSDTRVSRLRGLYCFVDQDSAAKATGWGTNFDPSYLSDLHVVGGVDPTRAVDANWISAAYDPGLPRDWRERYWTGTPFPGAGPPLWEVVVDQRTYVLGTGLRTRALDLIRRYMPRALLALEIGRLAAVVGSDLGNISCFLTAEPVRLVGRHMIDFRDANEPDFLARVGELRRAGHPMLPEAAKLLAEEGDEFVMPDLRPLNFEVLL